uniref:Transmembrane protein 131 n=1 Tax=Cyclopterus lumpus TaxID=8103 RepID=A0A8C2WV74_CYCLU
MSTDMDPCVSLLLLLLLSSHAPVSRSEAPHRGNCRPIRFEPPMLDFHEQPVGMPKMEKVYLHNPSSEEISLISISATTAHFHASFFQNRIIPPGGNTSFDVVFLARVVGNVENTLFINTSHHGVFTYQVFGVGIPNPYRLRPFIGARVPVNSSFSPLINIHNPFSEPLQVVEMYSSGGDLHLELPTGQQGGTGKLWEIPPFETKGVMRASFSSRDVDNHTAFIRIKTNAPNEDQFIILPVEVEVTSAPGIYSSTEMLDFGTLRSQDRPKLLNLHLLNSGTKDVPITSVRTTPSNEAVAVDFKAVTLKAGESRYTKVASISFDASKARRPFQFSGKITVKAKEKSYSKLEIPYQAEVLDGYLGFDHTATLFHIRDSPVDPVDRPIFLTNAFSFAIRIHNVSLPEEARTMFNVQNLSAPILIPPHESRYIFSLLFRPVRPSIHIDSNILLITNASKFHLPVRAYTGFLEPLVLPPSLKENILDFGVCSATDTSSVTFVVVNSNPIELEIKSWLVTGDSLSMELLKTEKGNSSAALSRLRELQNSSASQQKTVILASGYYAAFRVTLVAAALEGAYDGAVHITTDYEILTIPVRALIAVGTLNSSPKHIVLPASFPGKVVHQSFSIQSSFTQKVRLQQIRSLTEDIRFYYKRLRNNKDELEPRRKSKVANIYFDASLQCGDQCYVGLPFSKPHGLTLQEDIWDADVDLHQKLLRRWKELKERSGHSVEAVFEVNTDLQKNVQARITAHLTWPSLVNSSRSILFPLTNTNGSSEEEVILQNPADVLVYVQVLPLALLPNPSVFSGKLPFGNLSNINIDTSTLEFQVHRNQVSGLQSSSGFVEGSTRPFVYNLLLLPGEVKAFSVRFTPTSNHSVSSLLIVRNNLTVIDTIVLHGRGTTESLKVAGKPPGHGSSLRFKMTEALLKDCMDLKVKEPNFTLKRTFRVENTGLLPITIRPAQINGQVCEGYGFKVLNCQDFDLKPNASKDLIILFTPDFTSSRVIRELKLVTCGGSEFVFVLNASLPYHMLASCAETLPRPSWELELYVIVSLIMSSMFLLVIATAYLEAQSIWEPFKRRVSVEANSSMETGRPFNLREIVQIHSDSKRCRTRAPSPYRTKVPASVLAAGDQTRVQASEPCASCPFSGLESKGKLRGKTKAQRKKEEKEKKPAVKTLGDELKDNMADNDDSSSTTTETSNPDTEPSIKEVRVHQEEPHQDSLELPYVTPLENKQRKSFTSKAPLPVSGAPKARPTQKRFEGKLEDGRPSLLAGGPMPDGHSSSSDGEKDFAAPEWDVPLSNHSDCSLQQISLQTLNADPFLKRTSSTAETCSPPPTSPVLLSRGSYSSVLNSNSEGNQKKAPGNKLCAAPPLPGKNGTPTFAAVAAGYDKSPGKTDKPLAHMTSVESEGSDSSGLWSPIDSAGSPNFHCANSFSAFGPNSSFNLTKGTTVFSGMNVPKSSEPQQSWPEFSSASSIWDTPSSDSLHTWPSSSGSPTAPTSLLGSGRNPWSASTPFGSSIWSTSADSALHPFPPPPGSIALTDLVGVPAPSPPPVAATTELSRTYNPWNMWRPTLSRRSSEPWPSSSDT